MLNSHFPAKHSFVEFLVSSGRLSKPSLDRAYRLSESTSERLDVVLLRLSLISETDLASALQDALQLPIVASGSMPSGLALPTSLTKDFLLRARVVPVALDAETLTLAMADPTDDEAADAVAFATRLRVTRVIALPSDIEHALSTYFSGGTDEVVPPLDTGSPDENDAAILRDLASEAPIVRLVNRWLTMAVEHGASDIHVEPADDGVWVRWRVDGILTDADTQPLGSHAAIVSRIKIMARLDIGERRLPQDGRISLPVRGQEVDIRVSVLPSVRGESIVLRILDRNSVTLDFAALGFGGAPLERFRSAIERPNGIVLVTGPTGSGKTTTLYTALLSLRRPEVKILTVEDPVEFRFDHITQTQVHPQIGLDFANVLRSFLRHDPNIMMVGEIRDIEAARAAMQLALTGRLVLSTLHTNDAASAVARLIDMGIEDYLITATINGILAQRLVRRLCDDCREPYEPSGDVVRRLRLDTLDPDGPLRLFRPRGCPACQGRGFRGRCGIHEMLLVDDELRQHVMQGATATKLRAEAIASGMEPMYVDGALKALKGITTIDEVIAATWTQ